MARLVRIGVFSLARFQAAFMGLIGFILGLVFFFLSGTEFALFLPNYDFGFPVSMPIAMLVLLPLTYALAGFVFGLVFGFVFNFVASSAGGINFDIEKSFKED